MTQHAEMTMEDFLTALGCTSYDPIAANDLAIVLEMMGKDAMPSPLEVVTPAAVAVQETGLATHR